MKTLRISFLLIVTALFAAWGCGTDAPSDKVASCTQDADCEAGEYCGADNKCTQDCDPASTEPQCASGESCDASGRCVVQGECVIDDDCDSPPEDATCDAGVLVTYSQEGSCVTEDGENVCEYSEAGTPCENGCQDGACLGDPCAEVVCNSPPSAVCHADGMTLVNFADPGQCTEGVCQYEEVQMNCAIGCEAGQCLSGVCDNQDCNTPPDDSCSNNTAIRYSAQGTCVDDDGFPFCDYMPVFEDCSYTGAECNNAQCEGAVTQVGGVVIVEYMANPAGSFNDLGEWFEIANVSGAAIDINGWTIRSGAIGGDEEHVIAGAPVLDADASMVLAFSSAVPFTPDYNYDSVRLANNTDWLSLSNGADEVVDYVYYEPGAILDGRSRKLDPSVPQDVTSNDDYSNWCPSMGDEYAQFPSNYGTPGVANTACTVDPCQGFTCAKPQGFCIDGENKAVRYLDQNVMCEESRFNNPFCDFDTEEVQCTDGAELCTLGECLAIPDNLPAPGEVIITEVMPDPDGRDTDREWFELYNTTGGELSLFSLVFRNETGANASEYQFLDPTLSIAANSYVVFVRDTDPAVNGGVTGGIDYSAGNLVNSASGANLLSLNTIDGTLIDASFYANPTNGASFQLDPGALDATSNDEEANWCAGMTSYGDGGLGTPGAPNEPCD